MARAELKTTLSLDTTKFQKGMTKARATMAKLKESMGKVAKVVGPAMKAFAALGASAAAAGVAMVAAAKKGVGMIASNHRLAESTQMTARDTALWSEALKQAGIDAEQLLPITNSLMKNISDLGGEGGAGTLTDMFNDLGLSFKDLQGLSTSNKLKAIADALGGMTNASRKAAISQTLLGEEGAKMFGIFSDSDGALKKAQDALGGQLKILEKQGKEMSDLEGKFQALQTSFSGFFVGLASGFAESMDSGVDKLIGADFTALGQRIGMLMANVAKDFAGTMADIIQGVSGLVKTEAVLGAAVFAGKERKGKMRAEARGQFMDMVTNVTTPNRSPQEFRQLRLQNKMQEGGELFRGPQMTEDAKLLDAVRSLDMTIRESITVQ